MVVGLSCLVFFNQKTINDQQNTIISQQKQIDELNKQVEKLSTVTPDKLKNDAKTLLKQQGATFFNNMLNQLQQR